MVKKYKCVCVGMVGERGWGWVGVGGRRRRRQREKKEGKKPDLQNMLIIFHPIYISPQFNYSSTRITVVELFELIHVTNH